MLVIKDKLVLDNKKDVVLIHLYIKCKELNVEISDGIRNLLFYFYEMGGIETIKDFEELSKLCIKNTPIKTKGSVRNTLSKCVRLKIIENKGKYKKVLSSKWLPEQVDDIIGLEYKIMNNAI